MEKIARRALLALIGLALIFAAFGFGYFTANRRTPDTYAISVERGAALPLDYAQAAESLLPPEPININTATLEQLQTLDGVGPAIAQRIVDYREQIGGFTHTFQLMDVRGIGEKMYERIKNYVTVEDSDEQQ